jgi:hypothetical protein
MTGYEQSPDYGDQSFTWSDRLLIAALLTLIGAGVSLIAFIHTL